MGFCFCGKPSMGISPLDDESRHPIPLQLSAIPAAHRSARLPRQVTQGSPVLSGSPPQIPGMHDGASSLYQPSAHYPVPKIADFVGPAKFGPDNGNEFSYLAQPRAADTMNPSSHSLGTLATFAIESADTKSLSPLSSLINRIGIIGRTSPTRSNITRRMPEGACSTEDLAVVAHRAEVRRLMHKMMEDELQSEKKLKQQLHQLHPMRTYKRSSMSTIKESPADVSAVEIDTSYATVASMDGSESRIPFACAPTKISQDLSFPVLLAKKDKDSGETSFSKLPIRRNPVSSRPFYISRRNKSGMSPKSPRRERPLHPSERNLKKWMFASISAKQGETLDCQNAASEASVASHSTLGLAKLMQVPSENMSISVSSILKQGQSEDLYTRHLKANCEFEKDPSDPQTAAKGQIAVNSDSLSSLDEDGSIYEAHEARVYAPGQLRRMPRHSRTLGDMTKSDVWLQSRDGGENANDWGTTSTSWKNESQRASTLSRISSFGLHHSLLHLTPESEKTMAGIEDRTSGQPEEKATDIDNSQLFRKGHCSGAVSQDLSDLERESLGHWRTEPEVTQNNAIRCHSGLPKDGQASFYGGSFARDSLFSHNQSRSVPGTNIRVDNMHLDLCRLLAATKLNKNGPDVAASDDMEKMANEWHQQLQNLHLSSPASKGFSQTYPPSREPSLFRNPPQRKSALHLWPETLDSIDQGNPLPQNESLRVRSQTIFRRFNSTPKDRLQSDTWWMEPQEYQESQEVICIKPNISGHACTPATEMASAINPVDLVDEHWAVQDTPAEETSARTFSAGIERAIRAGLRKVMYRKQDISSLLPLTNPVAAISCGPTSSVSLEFSKTVSPDRSVTSIPIIKDNNDTPGNRIYLEESKDQSTGTLHSPNSLLDDAQDELQDIDSVIRVLVSMEQKRQAEDDFALGASSEEPESEESLAEAELIASKPSTPVVNAYAEVKAYITNAMGCERPVRATSYSSCYQDAASHQDNDAEDENA